MHSYLKMRQLEYKVEYSTMNLEEKYIIYTEYKLIVKHAGY